MDRSQLAPLYRDESRLTFQGVEVIGPQAISQKYTSLAFKSSQHNLQTVDYQPSPQGGLLVFVTGQLLVRPSMDSSCAYGCLFAARRRKLSVEIQSSLSPSQIGQCFRSEQR